MSSALDPRADTRTAHVDRRPALIGEGRVELGGKLLDDHFATLFIVDRPFPADGCNLAIDATPRWKVLGASVATALQKSNQPTR
jgi:hypothetical protein